MLGSDKRVDEGLVIQEKKRELLLCNLPTLPDKNIVDESIRTTEWRKRQGGHTEKRCISDVQNKANKEPEEVHR